MIGDPISIDLLFPAQGESSIQFCEARIVGLTNTGVACYMHGKMTRISRTGQSLLGQTGLEGGGVATFSDRTYEVDPNPALDRNSLRTPNDNGIQRFSTHEKDRILWKVNGPHPMQETEFSAVFQFGAAPEDAMPVPLVRHNNFLIGTSRVKRGGQTTFSFAFFEYPVLVP